MTHLITTLSAIRAQHPCSDGWAKLLAHLGKTAPDDEPLPVSVILESNGIRDAIWALRAVEGRDRIIRHFAADCAESVLHIFEVDQPNDNRPRLAIQAARDFADGKIDTAAWAAAGGAAWAAAQDAAWSAAQDAAGAAADAAQSKRLLEYCERGDAATANKEAAA